MARILNIRKQQGFSLIEALFSALLLGIALLALAGFQAVALQDSSLIKARSVAANLAQEKLDDLKSFTFLTDGDTTDDTSAASASNYCGQGTFCFTEIADNAGGQETSAGALRLPTGSLTGYIDNYTRTWIVRCSAEAAATAFSFSTTCNSSTVAKLVTVTITWTDSKNATQTVTLQGVIYAMDPSRAARGAINPFSTERPVVSYTPIGVPDAVPVPISTGEGKFKESSKPLPDVSSKGYSLRTEFDSVSYITAGGSSKKESQFEFSTVRCTCEFTGSGQGYPASYFYWDGASLKVKVPSATVTKMTGTAPTIGGDKQDDLCDTCCRDHHDSEAPGTANPTTTLYDPYRPNTDYTGNNHKHYYFADDANPQNGLVEIPESAGNIYLEACRFVRVDGFWRLLQDWQAIDLVVMPREGYLSNTTYLGNYQDYLIDSISYRVKQDCLTAGATGCNDIDITGAPSKSVLTNRDKEISSGNTAQLLARVIYLDNVYGASAPRTLDTTYYTSLSSRINSWESNNAIPWLDIVSFYEVNTTLLTSWHSDDTDSVSVTNGLLKSLSATNSDYYGVILRGEASVKSTGDGTARVYAYLLPSNTGLTGGTTAETYTGTVDYDASLAQSGTIPYSSEIGMDPHDHRSALRISDFITITRTGTSIAASGTILGGNSTTNLTGLTVKEIPGNVNCPVTFTNLVGSTASGSFNCPTPNYAGDVQLTLTGYYLSDAVDKDGSANYDATVDNVDNQGNTAIITTTTATNTCVSGNCGNFWVFGPTINVKGVCNTSDCIDANVTVSSKLNGTGAGVACTISGSIITCPVTLDASTLTWTGTFEIAKKVGVTDTIYLAADATSCSSTDGTSAKTTTSYTKGPADALSAFNVCATKAPATISPPAPPSTLSISGASGSGSTGYATFGWGDATGETGYKVFECTQPGYLSSSASAPCTPPSSSGSSVSNPGPGAGSVVRSIGKDTTNCYSIKATNTAATPPDGAASSIMCVSRSSGSGNTYTPLGSY